MSLRPRGPRIGQMAAAQARMAPGGRRMSERPIPRPARRRMSVVGDDLDVLYVTVSLLNGAVGGPSGGYYQLVAYGPDLYVAYSDRFYTSGPFDPGATLPFEFSFPSDPDMSPTGPWTYLQLTWHFGDGEFTPFAAGGTWTYGASSGALVTEAGYLSHLVPGVSYAASYVGMWPGTEPYAAWSASWYSAFGVISGSGHVRMQWTAVDPAVSSVDVITEYLTGVPGDFVTITGGPWEAGDWVQTPTIAVAADTEGEVAILWASDAGYPTVTPAEFAAANVTLVIPA